MRPNQLEMNYRAQKEGAALIHWAPTTVCGTMHTAHTANNTAHRAACKRGSHCAARDCLCECTSRALLAHFSPTAAPSTRLLVSCRLSPSGRLCGPETVSHFAHFARSLSPVRLHSWPSTRQPRAEGSRPSWSETVCNTHSLWTDSGRQILAKMGIHLARLAASP